MENSLDLDQVEPAGVDQDFFSRGYMYIQDYNEQSDVYFIIHWIAIFNFD